MNEYEKLYAELDRVGWHQHLMGTAFVIMTTAWCFTVWYIWRKGIPLSDAGGTLIASAFSCMLAIGYWNNAVGTSLQRVNTRLNELHRQSITDEWALLELSHDGSPGTAENG